MRAGAAPGQPRFVEVRRRACPWREERKEARIAERGPSFLHPGEAEGGGGSSPGTIDTLGSVAPNSSPFCVADPLAAPMRVKQMIGELGGQAWDIKETNSAHSSYGWSSGQPDLYQKSAAGPISRRCRTTHRFGIPTDDPESDSEIAPCRLLRQRLGGPM